MRKCSEILLFLYRFTNRFFRNVLVVIFLLGLETASTKQFESDSRQYTQAAIKAAKWNILVTPVNFVLL